MEKRGMSIKEFICHLFKKHVTERIILDVIDKLNDELLVMLQLAYDNNLLHNDSHLDNFMLNPEGEYDYSRLSIIDFGKSGIMPNPDRTFNDKYEKYNIILSENRFKSGSIRVLQRITKQELEHDLKLSFNMLKKTVIEKTICMDNKKTFEPDKKKQRIMTESRYNIPIRTETAPVRRGLFGDNESPAPVRRGLFGDDESPAPVRRGLFGDNEYPAPVRRGLFGDSGNTELHAPTDKNMFRNSKPLAPLSRSLFDSTGSPVAPRKLPNYDEFKQL